MKIAKKELREPHADTKRMRYLFILPQECAMGAAISSDRVRVTNKEHNNNNKHQQESAKKNQHVDKEHCQCQWYMCAMCDGPDVTPERYLPVSLGTKKDMLDYGYAIWHWHKMLGVRLASMGT